MSAFTDADYYQAVKLDEAGVSFWKMSKTLLHHSHSTIAEWVRRGIPPSQYTPPTRRMAGSQMVTLLWSGMVYIEEADQWLEDDGPTCHDLWKQSHDEGILAGLWYLLGRRYSKSPYDSVPTSLYEAFIEAGYFERPDICLGKFELPLELTVCTLAKSALVCYPNDSVEDCAE